MENIRYLGFVCNNYTPQVEGQLTRDIIRVLDMPEMRNVDLCMVSTEERCDRALDALGVRRSSVLGLTRTFIKYRTAEEWPQTPEHCEIEIERDLYQPIADLNKLDPKMRPGYYLPPQGRLAPNSVTLKRPAPNGYTPVDPALVILWG